MEPAVIQAAADKLEVHVTDVNHEDKSVTIEAGNRIMGGPAGNQDADGVSFNPDLHERDPKTREPVKTADGRWRKKRGGGGRAKKPITLPLNNGAIQAVASFDFRGSAEFLCTIMFGGLSNLGQCWTPKDDERRTIEDATAKYLQANNIADIPPGIGLMLALGVYAAPRIFHPETKETVSKTIAYLTGKDGPKQAPLQPRQPRTPEPEPKRMSAMPPPSNNGSGIPSASVHSPLDDKP